MGADLLVNSLYAFKFAKFSLSALTYFSIAMLNYQDPASYELI